MTPLHHIGDAIRDAAASLPLGLVRILFLALPVFVLVWVLRLPAEQTNLPMVLLIGAPYTVIPLLLIYRMWKPDPFGTA